MKEVYGYVNGKPVYSADEFRYTARGFGAIETDEELMRYAEKVTYGWSDHGWKYTFETFYLSDYCYSEPYHSLTHSEFERLKQLQAEARAAAKAAEEARCWQYVETTYWADNSVEELWRDKDGNEKTVMVVAPHGDCC